MGKARLSNQIQTRGDEGPYESFVDLLVGILLIFLILVVTLALLVGAGGEGGDNDGRGFGGDEPGMAFDGEEEGGGLGNQRIFRFDTGLESLFDPGAFELTLAGRRSLEVQLSALFEGVLETRANTIRIIGSTSPSRRAGNRAIANRRDASDSNIDLSALRAAAVAHFLHSRAGVPYRCMIIVGQGTNHTALDWDDQRSNRELERAFGDERSIEIFIERTDESSCDHERLSATMAELIETQ